MSQIGSVRKSSVKSLELSTETPVGKVSYLIPRLILMENYG